MEQRDKSVPGNIRDISKEELIRARVNVNKIKAGTKNLYVAPILAIDETKTDGTGYTYGKPFRVPGAQNINLAQQTATQDIAADDDAQYYTMTQDNGYDGTVQVVCLPPEFETEILKNVNGMEDADVKTADFAMMIEFDGDKKKGRHIFWHCVLTKRPDITGTTKDNNLTVDTDTINVKAVKRKDCGKIKAKVYEDWSVYNTMFTSVPAPADIVDPDAESVTISGDDTVEVSDTITLTATTKPSGTAVTWSSSDTSVATVTSGGVVTGVAEGTAVITAAFSDDAAVYGSKVITVTDEE
jgi:phi13 family phage major tail protein